MRTGKEKRAVEVKRVLVGKTVTVTVRGVPIKFEVGAGANAKGLAYESYGRRPNLAVRCRPPQALPER
jgi:hypothetical protein